MTDRLLAPAPLSIGLAAAIVGLLATGPAAAQTKVGVSSAVNANTTSIPPGQPVRTLLVGKDIAFNEKVITTTGGQAQILFLDESSFSVGENSEVVIDEFVYNPTASTGRIVASATKGVFRFVGGALSKNDGGVTFKTPSATIGIRGGIAIFAVDAATRTTTATLLFGNALTVTSTNGAVQRVTQPGFGTSVKVGGEPAKPTPTPPGQIVAAISQLEGRTTATAGATEVPTDTRIANSNVALANSDRLTLAVNDAITNQVVNSQLELPAPPDATIDPKDGAIKSIEPPSPSAPPPPATVGVIVPGTYSGQFQRTTSGTTNGFVDATADSNRPFINAVLDQKAATVTASLPAGNTLAAGTLTFTVPVTVANNGGFFFNQPITTPFGTGFATGDFSSDLNFFRATITEGGEQAFVFGGARPLAGTITQSTALRAFFVSNNTLLDSTIPFLSSTSGGNGGAIATSSFLTAVQPGADIGNGNGKGMQTSLSFSGTGPGQTSALVVSTGVYNSTTLPTIQTGTVGGTTRLDSASVANLISGSYTSTTDANGNALFGGTTFGLTEHNFSVIGGSVQATNIAGTQQDSFAPSLTLKAQGQIFDAGRNDQTIVGFAAGLSESTAPQREIVIGAAAGAGLVGTDVSITTDSGTNNVNATILVNNLGGGAGTARVVQFGGNLERSVFISDRVFAATTSATSSTVGGVNAASNVALVTSRATNAQQVGDFISDNFNSALTSLIPVGTDFKYCECDFVQWGFYSGDLANTNVAGGNERFHLNTWVAGPITNVAAMPTTGTAKYAGHAIGNVFDGTRNYVAMGDYSNSVDFARRTAAVTITNFDNRNISGVVNLGSGADLNKFAGALNVNGLPTFAATISGAFFGPNANETAGSFAVRDTAGAYRAAGVVVGKRP